MQIREANVSDYSAICSLINSELGYPNVSIDDLSSRMESMELDGNYQTCVAVLDGTVVGFIGTVQCIAHEISGFYLRISAMAVSKEHQNRGIGSSLLRHVEASANKRGITTFAVNSGLQRENAHIFYERNGYTKSSYGFWKGKK